MLMLLENYLVRRFLEEEVLDWQHSITGKITVIYQ